MKLTHTLSFQSTIAPKNADEEAQNTKTEQMQSDWLLAESFDALMQPQRTTMFVVLLLILVAFFIFMSHVAWLPLCIWFVVSMLLNGYRWWQAFIYTQKIAQQGTQARLSFRQRQKWLWFASALVWGSLIAVFHADTKLLYQFAGWYLLAIIAIFATTGFAPDLRAMRLFVYTLITTTMVVMTVQTLYHPTTEAIGMLQLLIPSQLFLGALLDLTGKRLNQSHKQRLLLQHNNETLIASLKSQTELAMSAIDTKNRFLSSAAHDIRQPVLALDMYVNWMQEAPDMAPQVIPKITTATRSVIDMFDSLFDLSRMDAGQLSSNSTFIHIDELIRVLEVQYQPLAKNKNLQLRVRPTDAIVHTDLQLLKRVIGNLVMNAIKYTPKGGVLLAARSSVKGVRLEIWDTGVGIEADQQEAVFQEFYKTPSQVGISDGFGLGLSIVTRLCTNLDFDFGMQSVFGRGSVFYVDIKTVEKNVWQKTTMMSRFGGSAATATNSTALV